ncbi:hypothetical protein FDP41_012066 [Naegleria fowleri]|uniref:T-cell immunomodulatory protein TIP C2 domain-containing protein n=1 Tax=Naegleria fowleri TaxID=5763 RepID=A0A6A5CA04_NAEFO|nr:uncharacterized protein FDP41_012066 [Naegleria fowleri]KAF0982205.1 hypothetical protein FDP41_012066 [Naegleria fowleri]
MKEKKGIKLFPPSFSHAPSFLFRESILYDVSSNVGFNGIEGRIEASGDFANQQHTDLIVSSKNRKQIIIYTWDTYQWNFVNYTSFDYETSSKLLAHVNVEIVNIVASDFNFDGALDLLVTLIDKDTFDDDNPSYIHSILVGNFKTLREEKLLDERTTDQLLVFDLNGDLLPDLFGTDVTTKKRSYWINNNTNYEAGQLNFIKYLQDGHDGFPTIDSATKKRSSFATSQSNLKPLAFPISTASIDIDGDCGSDLFVMSCSKEDAHGFCEEPIFEFWINYNGKLQLNSTLNAPKGAGRPVFLDIDHDGDLDMLYPVCYPLDSCSETNEIHILYNNQLALCKSIIETNCRPSSNLCMKSNFDFNQKAVLSFPKDNKRRILHHYKPDHRYQSSPPSLRVGDFNLDGYPDLVVSVVETIGNDENDKDSYQMVGIELWQNVECEKETNNGALSPSPKTNWYSTSWISSLSQSANNDQSEVSSTSLKCDSNVTPRTYQIVSKGVDALRNSFFKLPYATGMNEMPFYDAFFLDIDETGILDIITLYNDPKSGNQTLRAFFNCFYNDAYFLKVISTNGVAPEGTQYYYGVNAPSMTVKFISTKLNGEYQPNMNSLLSQTSYLSLQTPYHLFGIGRTNGYIEKFFVGRVVANSSIHEDFSTNYYEASAIMPNSQLVTITTPPNDPGSWQVQLFVNPSAAALWVIIAEVVSLILLFIPIAILYIREYRHDKKEKEESSREISSVFI